MGVMKTGLIAVMVSALSVQSGCSFLFVKGPPPDHANMASFDCTESNTMPVLDTIWAALNGIGAIEAAGDSSTTNQGTIVAVGVSWLVLSGAAAIYGFSKTSDCKAAWRDREERNARNPPPPGYAPYPYPPQPGYAPYPPQPGYPSPYPQSSYPQPGYAPQPVPPPGQPQPGQPQPPPPVAPAQQPPSPYAAPPPVAQPTAPASR